MFQDCDGLSPLMPLPQVHAKRKGQDKKGYSITCPKHDGSSRRCCRASRNRNGGRFCGRNIGAVRSCRRRHCRKNAQTTRLVVNVRQLGAKYTIGCRFGQEANLRTRHGSAGRANGYHRVRCLHGGVVPTQTAGTRCRINGITAAVKFGGDGQVGREGGT